MMRDCEQQNSYDRISPTLHYQVFQGRNTILLGGKCITAKEGSMMPFSLLLSLLVTALFLAFDGPYLVEHLSWAVPILGFIIELVIVASLLRTSFSDPGIIPRAKHSEGAAMGMELNVHCPVQVPARQREVDVQGRKVTLKYCNTCNLFRPPRASHCSNCNNCVDGFDHFCPWTGNCIGLRNYRYFTVFVTSCAVGCLYFIIFSLYHVVKLSKEEGGFNHAASKTPASLIVILICFFMGWSVGGLACFHFAIAARFMTTHEHIRGTFNRDKSPFSSGSSCKNILRLFCGPRLPSLLRLREEVHELDGLDEDDGDEENGLANLTVTRTA